MSKLGVHTHFAVSIPQLSRTLLRASILLLACVVMTGLLCGLSSGIVWAFRDTYDGIVLSGFSYTAFFAYVACLTTLAGCLGTGLVGLALRVVAWTRSPS